jgi:hypothetical protein
MSTYDEIVSLVYLARSYRTPAEASKGWPAFVKALGRVRDRIRAESLDPRRRPSPGVEHALVWLHRSLYDAEALTDAQREEAEGLVTEIACLVAVVAMAG